MKEMIVHAFQQAYENFIRRLAEFLPRLLVMLLIIAIGALVAYLVKNIVRAILRIAKVDNQLAVAVVLNPFTVRDQADLLRDVWLQ